jgi:hypothetical protein
MFVIILMSLSFFMEYLKVWYWLFFKVFFTWKNIKIIFILFLKNYFWYRHIKIIWKYLKKLKKIKF